MKYFASVITSFALLTMSAGAVFAAPFNAHDKNPQVVAYYETGSHGIVGENDYHEGTDLVMRDGSNGGFQQWFYGNSSVDGLHGDHSVWRVLRNGDTCSNDWDLVKNPNPAWGDYLTPGVDYCVHTNDFHPSH